MRPFQLLEHHAILLTSAYSAELSNTTSIPVCAMLMTSAGSHSPFSRLTSTPSPFSMSLCRVCLEYSMVCRTSGLLVVSVHLLYHVIAIVLLWLEIVVFADLRRRHDDLMGISALLAVKTPAPREMSACQHLCRHRSHEADTVNISTMT